MTNEPMHLGRQIKIIRKLNENLKYHKNDPTIGTTCYLELSIHST
jgi:hypothetical protein